MNLKKIVFHTLFLSGFLFIHQAYGQTDPERDGNNVFVNIQNLGSENCQLMEKKIVQGQLLYSNIPSTLYATGENNEFIIQATWNKGAKSSIAELTLKYACGAHKKFSLYIKNFQKKHYKHRSTDVVFDAVDVFETRKLTPGWIHCSQASEYGPVCGGRPTKLSLVVTH